MWLRLRLWLRLWLRLRLCIAGRGVVSPVADAVALVKHKACRTVEMDCRKPSVLEGVDTSVKLVAVLRVPDKTFLRAY